MQNKGLLIGKVSLLTSVIITVGVLIIYYIFPFLSTAACGIVILQSLLLPAFALIGIIHSKGNITAIILNMLAIIVSIIVTTLPFRVLV